MSNNIHTKISKFLSLVLRHSPATIQLTMDKNGWVAIDELIENANKYRTMNLDLELVKLVVATNDKHRFIISEDGKSIRANQGHSVNVDLELESKTPPDMLYHGTVSDLLEAIMREGLLPMSRRYVHLSPTLELARKRASMVVNRRRSTRVRPLPNGEIEMTLEPGPGKALVLYINAKAMYEAGHQFYLSANNVWLVDQAPAQYISVKI